MEDGDSAKRRQVRQLERFRRFVASMPEDQLREALARSLYSNSVYRMFARRLSDKLKAASDRSKRSVALSFQLRTMKNDAEALARGAQVAFAVLRDRPRQGAAARWRGDPKAKAKAECRIDYDDWQAGRSQHKSAAAFALWVVEKYPALESPKVVAGWVTAWRKEDRKPAS